MKRPVAALLTAGFVGSPAGLLRPVYSHSDARSAQPCKGGQPYSGACPLQTGNPLQTANPDAKRTPHVKRIRLCTSEITIF